MRDSKLSRSPKKRCSPAAVSSSALVGKWCIRAPRETPARASMTAVVAPAQPCSTNAVDGRRQQSLASGRAALRLGAARSWGSGCCASAIPEE